MGTSPGTPSNPATTLNTERGFQTGGLRAGFVEEGIRRAANLHADGWHDMMLYSHLATDEY